MRFLPVALVAVLLVVPAPGLLRADEPPADQPAKPPPLPSPKAAFAEIMGAVRTMPRAQQMPERTKRVQAYLEAWAAAGTEAAGEDLLYVGRMQAMADRPLDARATYQQVAANESLDAALRDQAATGEAGLLRHPQVREALGEEALAAATGRLLAHVDDMEEPERRDARASLQMSLAMLAEMAERNSEAVTLRMQALLDNPAHTANLASSIAKGLMAGSHSLEAYPAMHAAAAAVLPVLRSQQMKLVTEAQAKLEAARQAGDEKAVAQAENGVKAAEYGMKRIASAGLPFALLGRPLPSWTLEHAWGEVKAPADLHGKVVLIDFWATWCGWCIKSFPALRDLVRDYAGKDLAVLGVTASANFVWESNYRLDEDMKHKLDPKAGSLPVAYLQQEGRKYPENGVPVLPEPEYRAREIEALTTFLANHEIPWPVILIDKAEPSDRYALAGWPHAIVLDRQGRVRYFKSGALLRDKPEAVAAFRKVLDDLLAEPAGEGGAH